MLSNAAFILGDDEKDKIEELRKGLDEDVFKICEKAYAPTFFNRDGDSHEIKFNVEMYFFEKEFEKKLEEQLFKKKHCEKVIYDCVKNFVCNGYTSFDSELKDNGINAKVNDMDDYENFKIKKLTFDCGNDKKTIVFLTKNNFSNNFSEEDSLYDYNLSENFVNKYIKEKINFSNENSFRDLNLVLDPSRASLGQSIVTCDIANLLPDATLNLPNSKFTSDINIGEDTVVNACGSEFYTTYSIGISNGGILNAYHSSFRGKSVNLNGGSLNANLSNISSKLSAGSSLKNTININGSHISHYISVTNTDVYAIGSEISSYSSTITCLIKDSNLYAHYSKIEQANFYVKNSEMFIKFSSVKEPTLIQLESSKINILGCSFNCKNIFITPSDSWVYLTEGEEKGYELKANSEENAKLLEELSNKLSNEQIIRMLKSPDPYFFIACQVFGIFCMYKGCSSIISFAKSKFLSKKTIETPACKVKTPVV